MIADKILSYEIIKIYFKVRADKLAIIIKKSYFRKNHCAGNSVNFYEPKAG